MNDHRLGVGTPWAIIIGLFCLSILWVTNRNFLTLPRGFGKEETCADNLATENLWTWFSHVPQLLVGYAVPLSHRRKTLLAFQNSSKGLQLFWSTKPSLKPRKEQRNQQNNRRANTMLGCTKPGQERPRLSQLSRRCFDHLWSRRNTHTCSICLESLQFHISLIKSSYGIFKNKATAGFYTLTAEASCFVTQHTLLSLRRRWVYQGTRAILYIQIQPSSSNSQDPSVQVLFL